jgi:hypothetical protein
MSLALWVRIPEVSYSDLEITQNELLYKILRSHGIDLQSFERSLRLHLVHVRNELDIHL